MKSNISIALIATALSFSPSAAFADFKVETHGGIKVYDDTSPDYYFQINGKIRLDQTAFPGKGRVVTLADGSKITAKNSAYIRAAELNFSGGLGPDVEYALDLDFQSPKGDTSIGEANVTYTGWDNIEVSVGQVGSPFSIEGTNGGSWLHFRERSMPVNAFSPDMGLGVNAKAWNDYFMLNVAVTQPPHNKTDSLGSDRVGEAVRLIFAPIQTEDTVYQIGVYGLHQDIDTSEAITTATTKENGLKSYASFSVFPESRTRDKVEFVNTGKLRAKNYQVYGAEVAVQKGSLLIEGDYIAVKVKGRGEGVFAKNYKFGGYHVQAGYLLTGEKHKYKFRDGSFGRVTPNAESGAWEVATRYSFINLNDKDVLGGSQHNVTFGVNWYANKNLKVSADVIRSFVHPTSVNATTGVMSTSKSDKKTVNSVGLRLQAIW